MTDEEIEKMMKDIKIYNENGFGRWGWFSVVHHLAKGDITKFEDVCDMEFLLVLNTLSFEKEKGIKEDKEKKQMEQASAKFR